MVEDNPKMNELEELYEFAGGGIISMKFTYITAD